VKAIAITEPTHNPIEQTYWASGLRENFTSRSYGEGLETGRKVPRQSLTRQLFFRWIKMHLRVKAFFGTSENAVKSQIWIAVSVYVLVAIIKKRLNLSRSLYETLQILSLNLFEKTPLDIALSRIPTASESDQDGRQLILL
jgi:hypothetical protein